MELLILLVVMSSFIIYAAGVILAFGGEIFKGDDNKGAATTQPTYTTPNIPTAAPVQKQAYDPDFKNVVERKKAPAPEYVSARIAGREAAIKWIKENADFIISETGKAPDSSNQRNFVIGKDMLSDLSEEGKKQLVLLLLEKMYDRITEAVLDKEGNINCYYYLG